MAIHEHPVYSQIELDATLWRYMTYDKFRHLLTDRALFFCRADKFADIYEGSIPRREAEIALMKTDERRNFMGNLLMKLLPGKGLKTAERFIKALKKRLLSIAGILTNMNPMECGTYIWMIMMEWPFKLLARELCKRCQTCRKQLK